MPFTPDTATGRPGGAENKKTKQPPPKGLRPAGSLTKHMGFGGRFVRARKTPPPPPPPPSPAGNEALPHFPLRRLSMRS